MQRLVWQNSNGDEINLTSGNYGITNWEGFSNTSLNIQSQQVPFQDGGVFLDALMGQRELSVTLAMNDGNDLEKRYRMKRELIHALNPKLGEGYLIYTNDFISKRIKCVAQIPLFETHNSNDSGTPKASLAWTACEPYWEDLEETEVNISKFGTVVANNGDVETEVKITFEREENQDVYNSPDIYNEVNGNYLKVNGEYSTPVIVNTNNGQKSAYYQGLNLKELDKNSNLGGLQYSKAFKCVLFLQDGKLKKLLSNGEYEIIKTQVSFYKVFDDMILIGMWDSESEDYINKVTLDLVNWQTVSSTWLAMQKMSENVYNIYKFSSQTIASATLTIANGIITIGEWVEDSYFSNYFFAFDVIVYNSFLKEIVVFGKPYNSSEGIHCYTKKNNVWKKKGEVRYPSNFAYYGFVEETNSMLIYGTQYGDILRSVDGTVWESFNITGQVNSINYIKEKGYYVAVGRDLNFYSPLIAISKDLINWEYIDYESYAKERTDGSFGNLVFDSEKNIFYISSGYYNKNDEFVYLVETNLVDRINVIDKTEGNMGFKLIIGNNKLYINNDVKCTLSYRQKYIGV